MTDIKQSQILLPPESTSFSIAKYLTGLLNRLQPSPETLVLIVALVIGGSSGLAMILFHRAIALSKALSFGKLLGITSVWGGWTVALIPILGGLIVGGIKWFFPQVLGQDFHRLISDTREQKVSPWRAPIKMLAASVSLGTGASLGPESPSVEIGSVIGILLGQLFQVSKDRIRLLLGAGAAAGLAAGFNAPIAGVFFALEVILGAAFTTPAASLILLSAFVSATLARAFSGVHPAFDLPGFEVVGNWEWLFYLGLGVLASLVAYSYTRAIKLAQACFSGEVAGLRWLGQLPLWLQPVIGGVILGLVALKLPQVLGVDYGTVEQILAGGKFSVALLYMLLIVKTIVTAISLGSGFVGGVFAPAMFLGACLGSVYGNFIGATFGSELAISPAPAYAIVGMAAVLAGSVKAPLTAIALLFELTQNYLVILPLMCAVGTCVWIVGLIQEQQSTEGLNLQQMGMNLKRQDDGEVLEYTAVADMMSTNYLSLPASLSILEAGQKILAYRCHTALVIDSSDRLVGVFTVADLKAYLRLVDTQELDIRRSLRDICTTEILCVYADEPLLEAWDRMGARGLYLLPVVDASDPRQILGVISREQIELAGDIISTKTVLEPYLSSLKLDE